MNKKYTLLLITLLLLVAFYVRAHNVTALPPFNDESHHIRRAERVWSFEDSNLSFTIGKLLTYYWIGIFNPDRLDAIFVARTVTGLAALLGLAGAYAAAKRLFGMWAGVLTLYLLAFAPFMVFFDRMALSDPLTAALGMLTVWVSLLMVDHPDEWRWGLLAGLLATLTILAKLIGVPFALIPVWAILLLDGKGENPSENNLPIDLTPSIPPPNVERGKVVRQGGEVDFHLSRYLKEKWARYRTTLLACYGTVTVMMTPFIVRIIYKELSGNRISVVDPHLINHKNLVETLLDNLADLWAANITLNHLVFVVAAAMVMLLALRRRPRLMLFALGCVALPWGALMVSSGVLSTRYMQIGVPPLFVAVAGAFVVLLTPSPLKYPAVGTVSMLSDTRSFPSDALLGVPTMGHRIAVSTANNRPDTRSGQLLFGWLLATLWIVFFAQPFIVQSWDEPRNLHLPERDRWEYFTNFTAGYGLRDAAAYMPRLTPSTTSGKIPVIGLVGSCHQIRLYLDEFGPVYLECPAFGWEGEYMDAVADFIDQRVSQESFLYLLVEPDLPYTDLSKLHVQHQVVARFARPFDGMRVELWRVIAAEGGTDEAKAIPDATFVELWRVFVAEGGTQDG